MARHWEEIRKAMRGVPKHGRKIAMDEEQLKRVFLEHDKNGDGHLDKNELKAAFRKLGSRLPSYRADRAILYSDIDADGVIHNEHEINHLVSYAMHYGYGYGYSRSLK